MQWAIVHVLRPLGLTPTWSELVESMQQALDDRSHVTNLGYALGLALILYINFKVARWLMRQLSPKS